jgi:hypothetical protein
MNVRSLAIEYELDPVTLERTGRTRRTQFRRTMRYQAVPPSARGAQDFT